MAMTVEQQRALAIASAKAAADRSAPAAEQPQGGNWFTDTVGNIVNGVGSALQTEAKNTDWSNPGQAISDKLSAGFTSGVEALPFVGPQVLSGLEHFKAGVQGRPYEDVAASDKAQVEQNPVSSAAGTTAGVVLPFVAGGEIPGAARFLGMEGGLASRIGWGAASSGAIETGDAKVRGDDWLSALGKGAMAAGFGGAFPIAQRGLGDLASLITGRAAPREAKVVARALRDDGVPVDQIPQRLSDLGPDAMLMDLGPNLQAQAGAVASVPGPGQKIVRDAVANRGKGASQRVADDVTATVGNGPDIDALKSSVVSYQQKAASPIYNSIRNVPLSNMPALAAVAKTPMGRQALTKAYDLMANDGVKLKPGTFTVGLADYWKRALDDLASSAARGGENNIARQARNMTKAITGAVDKAVPAYKKARDAFAGPAQVLDAIDQGAAVFGKEMSPNQLKSALSGMTASERQGFLHGAQSQIEALMGNAVNDVATLRNTFRKGWNEDKLRILLGEQMADDLLKRIDRELAYGKTSNAVASNSETARRQASQAEVNPATGSVSQPGKTFLGLVFDAFNGARNAISGVRQPQINAGMARLHTTGVGQLSAATLRQLQNGSRASGKALVAPAAPALLEERARQPISITVRGGA